MIRLLIPTDLAVLLLFLGKSPTNSARTRERFSGSSQELLSIVQLLGSCLISEKRRHNLAYAHRGRIQGLVTLRQRSGPSAWEIQSLLLEREYEKFCVDLLESLGLAGNEGGIERLFLRLESSSPVTDIARQAGFGHYLTETQYRLEGNRVSGTSGVPPGLRLRTSNDDYGIFRLYSATTPLQVRTVEGMVFQEWWESRDRSAAREFVLEHGGEIAAWVRIRSDKSAGQFDIVTGAESDEMRHLVDYCLSAVSSKYPVYCLASEYQIPLRRAIAELGFRPETDYSCLSKQLVSRVREPQLVPQQA